MAMIRLPLVLVAALLLAGVAATASPGSAAAAEACSTSDQPSYSVTVCFSAPLAGGVLAGNSAVTTSVSVTGVSPGVQRLVFTLDGEPLLTDVSAPYEFEIPTAKFADGAKTLTAAAQMRDGFSATPVSIGVTFSNGNSQPPINTNSFTPHTPSGSHGRLFATGDGAGGRPESAAVASSITAMNPDMFLYLGDVYAKGTSTEFFNWYGHNGSYYNALYDITNPVIGNHEYENGVAPGYFDYWDNIPNYYSYDALGWHFIALNSDIHIGQFDPGTAQYDWLQQDLAASGAACTMVSFHHPRFSVGPEGSTPRMQPIWQLLADNGVDVVLNGHDHSYQRWQRLDGAGNPDPDGIMQFVVGTGGHGVQGFVASDPRMAAGIDSPGNEGSLRADLNPAGAEFAYVSKNGDVLDSKPLECSGAGPDTSPPTTPTQLTAVASGSQVDLSWSSAQDDVAVAGYTVYRDGAAVATVDAPATSYTDLGLDPNTTYEYQVDAYDTAGNHSPRTAAEQVSTPAPPPAADKECSGSLAARKTQKQKGAKIVVKVKVKAGEDLQAKATGKVNVGKRSYRLEPQTENIRSDNKETLKLKPRKRKDQKKIAKALKNGRKAKAKLKVKLTDEVGNTKTKELSVKLKR
jgi:Calcineurin-like phosphoesterase/Fibronectin type III domain/Bacterial Ig domain